MSCNDQERKWQTIVSIERKGANDSSISSNKSSIASNKSSIELVQFQMHPASNKPSIKQKSPALNKRVQLQTSPALNESSFK